MEIKTEAGSNDITECRHDDKPTTGMLLFSDVHPLHLYPE